jgi:hypothetical protein
MHNLQNCNAVSSAMTKFCLFQSEFVRNQWLSSKSNHKSGDFSVLSFYCTCSMSCFSLTPICPHTKYESTTLHLRYAQERGTWIAFFKYSEYKRRTVQERSYGKSQYRAVLWTSQGPKRLRFRGQDKAMSLKQVTFINEPSSVLVRERNGFASGDRTRRCLSSRWLLLMNRPL